MRSASNVVWLLNLLALAAAAPTVDPVAKLFSRASSSSCGQFIPNEYIVSLNPQADIQKHLSWIKTLNLGGFAGVHHQYGFPGFQGYAASFNAATAALIKASTDILHVSQDSVFCTAGVIHEPLKAREVDVAAREPYVESREAAGLKLSKRVNIIQQTNAPPPLRVISQRPYPQSTSYFEYDSLGYGSYSYIVDSGIQTTHREFYDSSGTPHSSMVYTYFGNDYTDYVGHGTFVSSITGGQTFGVAKATLLLGVKVFNATGSSSGASIIAGFNFAVNDIINKGRTEKAIINMSLGGGPNPSFDNAVNAASSNNIFIAVAAGNSQQDVSQSSPASAASAFTAAAITDNYSSYQFASAYSNFGAGVDVLAPGTNVQGAAIGSSNTGVATGTGTSFSSPHVAGTIAMFVSVGNYNQSQMAYFVPAAASMNAIGGLPNGTPNKLLYTYSGH